jgi:hypothetical protein
MSNAMKVTWDQMTTEIFSSLMDVAPQVGLGYNAVRDLKVELGSEEAVLRYLASEATKHQKPVYLNVPEGSGSRTLFIAPEGWSDDRLKGWVATAVPGLESMIGPVKHENWEHSKIPGRNEPCFCASGKKFKRCHGAAQEQR